MSFPYVDLESLSAETLRIRCRNLQQEITTLGSSSYMEVQKTCYRLDQENARLREEIRKLKTQAP